jgi:signal transduction histidine kinase
MSESSVVVDHMPRPVGCPLAVELAARMRVERESLVRRWLDRIVARVSIEPNSVFPTDQLLDHVPVLIDGIADYLERPSDDIAADAPVVAKAQELGELRWAQGFDAYEILKEHELLGGVLFAFMARAVDTIERDCSRAELLQCAHRVFRAVEIIQQATTSHFLRRSAERVREREEQLRRFNRMVSHELKNRVGAIVGAHAMLREEWIGPAERARFMDMVGDNATGIRAVLDNLVALSQLERDARQGRNVRLPQAIAESVRQLRDMARAREVHVRVREGAPDAEVNAAVVELCLNNFVSNAIKYSDPSKPDRWVEVRAEQRPAPGHGTDLVVAVADNGLGVPAAARERLFQQFFRAHEGTADVEGTGLGLSIVRETVESLGGRAWAEFGDEGSVFAFALPYRRAADAAGAAGGPWGRERRGTPRVSAIVAADVAAAASGVIGARDA